MSLPNTEQESDELPLTDYEVDEFLKLLEQRLKELLEIPESEVDPRS